MAYGIESARPEPGDGVAPHGGWAQPVHSGGDGASTQETDLLDPWSPLALRGHVPGTRTSVPLPALRQAPRRAQRCALELIRAALLGETSGGGPGWGLVANRCNRIPEHIRALLIARDPAISCLFQITTTLRRNSARAVRPMSNSSRRDATGVSDPNLFPRATFNREAFEIVFEGAHGYVL